MRVTNGMIVNSTLLALNNNMTGLSKLYDQMTTGKKIQTVSEDPIIAGRAMKLNINVFQNSQFQSNVKEANAWMDTTTTVIDNISKILTDVRTKCVQGANGTLTEKEQNALNSDIRELWDQLTEEGNVSYLGRSIFTGYVTDEPLILTEDYTLAEDMKINNDGGMSIASGTTLSGVSTNVKTGSVLGDGTVLGTAGLAVGTDIAANTTLTGGTKLTTGSTIASGSVLGKGTTLTNAVTIPSGSTVSSGNTIPSGSAISGTLPAGTEVSAADAVALGLTPPAGATTYKLTTATATPASFTSTGEITLGGDMTLTGAMTLGGNMTLTGDVTLGGNVAVGATGMTIAGSLTLANGSNIAGGSTLGGKVTLLQDYAGNGTTLNGGSKLAKGSVAGAGSNFVKGNVNPAVFGRIDKDEMRYQVGSGSSITVNALGMDYFYSDTLGCFEELITMIDEAQAGGYDSEEIRSKFNDKIGEVSDLLSKISEHEAKAGSKITRANYTEDRLSEANTTLTELLSGIEDVDIEKTYVDFSTQYATYTSALQAASKILTNTLADYL